VNQKPSISWPRKVRQPEVVVEWIASGHLFRAISLLLLLLILTTTTTIAIPLRPRSSSFYGNLFQFRLFIQIDKRFVNYLEYFNPLSLSRLLFHPNCKSNRLFYHHHRRPLISSHAMFLFNFFPHQKTTTTEK